MNSDKIHYLPKYVNCNGDLVVFTKDISILIDVPIRKLEVTRLRLLYGFSVDETHQVRIPKTIAFEDALTLVEEIISEDDNL